METSGAPSLRGGSAATISGWSRVGLAVSRFSIVKCDSMAAKTAADAVRRYLKRLEPGTVFTPAELVHARLGSEDAVRQALRRLASAGDVRRLSKGYYDVPRVNPRIGVLSPTPEAIIAAHERKTGATIERPEVDAANKLGLTTQVVARPVYRTNLFPRDLNIGGQCIRLRTAGPRSLAGKA
ncbi:MAG: DUF6088 family protein [Vulcanimicrobiaceae bacterium]